MKEITLGEDNWEISSTGEVSRIDTRRRRANTYTSGMGRRKISEESKYILPPLKNKNKLFTVNDVQQTEKKRAGTVNDTLQCYAFYRTEEYKRDILCERVKEFLTKEIPGKPPSSLRYKKPKKKEKVAPTFTLPVRSSSPINTNSCPNFKQIADHAKWNYHHRPGKCRYLRYPPTPPLQSHEIFFT